MNKVQQEGNSKIVIVFTLYAIVKNVTTNSTDNILSGKRNIRGSWECTRVYRSVANGVPGSVEYPRSVKERHMNKYEISIVVNEAPISLPKGSMITYYYIKFIICFECRS